MDIARLTSYSPSYPVPSRSRERALELVSALDTARPARDPVERVVQGEVLQRQRADYSPTQDYLNSRLFDGSHVADAEAQSRSNAGRSGNAVGAYLSHTRELIQPDSKRGKQVDYFI